MVAWYNATLAVTHGLFIVWNIDAHTHRHSYPAPDTSFSFVYPYMSLTVNMLCGVVIFLVAQYCGIFLHHRLHGPMRFYVISVAMDSLILYFGVVLGIVVRLDFHDMACVVIICLFFPWMNLGLMLYHAIVQAKRDRELRLR